MNNKQRALLVKNAEILISYAPQIHYVQQRPMVNEHDHINNVVKRFKKGIDMGMDCSESVSFLYFTSGLGDPNGMNFDGYGNSGAMWSHLTNRYTNPADAHPGALGVYGPEGDEHVVMALEGGSDDPWLFSHGSEIGPLKIRLSDESDAHRGQPFTFLDVSKL